MISLIAAMDRNRNIGFNGDMPWGTTMKADLNRFKALTIGKPVVMGRKTLESIGKPLPNRTNIVLTTSTFNMTEYDIKHGVITANSVEDVLKLHSLMVEGVEFFIIGGATVYEQFLPHADKLYLTRINGYFEGDTKFPALVGKWNITENEPHKPDEQNPYGYTFMTYERG